MENYVGASLRNFMPRDKKIPDGPSGDFVFRGIEIPDGPPGYFEIALQCHLLKAYRHRLLWRPYYACSMDYYRAVTLRY